MRAATASPAPEKVLPVAGDSVLLDQYLLDKTPDDDIKREMQALGVLIGQHTEYNYHSQPVVERSQVSNELQALGFPQDHSDLVAGMACNPTSRQPALQHVISTVIFSSVSFQAQGPNSMLPASMGSFLSQVAPASRNAGEDHGKLQSPLLSILVGQWSTNRDMMQLFHQH